MQLNINEIEGKYYYVHKVGKYIEKDKVTIKKSKKCDNYYVTKIKFPFGKKKYKLSAAELASHIQRGDLVKR